MQREDVKTPETSVEVYYWPGTIDNIDALIKQHRDKIQKLINRDYTGLNLEALNGSDIFSIRLNQSDRLLFARVKVNGSMRLMMLEVVLQHDLQKARFLRPRVLRNFLDLHGQALLERSITAADFTAVEKEDAFVATCPDTDATITLAPTILSGSKFIKMNTGVESLPLIIAGPAGSGKSSSAMALLQNTVIAMRPVLQNDTRILYVTESAQLTNVMRRNWFALPMSQADELCEYRLDVDFKSYAQLLEALDSKVVDLRMVSALEFKEFINEKLKPLKRSQSKSAWRKAFFTSQDAMYQEFRIISGCPTEDYYYNRGANQSLFDARAEREWLFNQYKNYAVYLQEKGCYDPAFYTPTTQPLYSTVIVDEAQDFSHLQLEVMRQLAFDDRICFCKDDRQSLVDNLSKDSYINDILGARVQQVTYRHLPSSYRCPNTVLAMANAVSTVTALATGHSRPVDVKACEDNKAGSVTWYDALSADDEQALKEMAKSTEFAIVADAGLVESLSKRFETPQVFTYEGCKGLEFSHVFVYQPIAGPIFKEANAFVTQNERVQKRGETRDHLGPAFNAVYTAFTRATNSLIIFQESRHEARHIISLLRDALPKSSCSDMEKLDVSSRSEWLRKVDAMLANEKEDIAKKIFTEKLGGSEREFLAYKDKYLAEDNAVPVTSTKKEAVSPASADTTSRKNKTKKAKNQSSAPAPKSAVELDYVRLAELSYRTIIAKPSVQSIENLFSSAVARRILFVEMPAYRGECIFTLLCDDKNIRIVLLTNILPGYLDKLAPYITTAALCRKNMMDDALSGKMPPLFWISQNESTLHSIRQSNAFVDAIGVALKEQPSVLLVPWTNKDSNYGTFILYWLSANDTGIALLFGLVMENNQIAAGLSSDALVLKFHRSLGHLGTSVFHNLFTDQVGINLLKLLFRANAALAANVTLQDLFPFRPDGKGKYKIIHAPIGGEVLGLLDSVNASLGASMLHTMSEKQLAELDAAFNAPEIRYARELVTIYKLLDHPTLENLQAMFSAKQAATYLFHIPVKDDECLFTVLFDNVHTRTLMLEEILIPFSETIGKSITGTALCRVHLRDGNYPPLLWMCGRSMMTEQLLKWVKMKPELVMEIKQDALYKNITVAEYLGAKIPKIANVFHNEKFRPVVSRDGLISATTLMLYSEQSLQMLDQVFSGHRVRLSVSPVLLHEPAVTDVSRKIKISIFQMLASMRQGVIFLLPMLLKTEGLLTKESVYSLLSADTSSDTGEVTESSMWMVLSASKPGLTILGLMLSMICESCSDERILKVLTYALTADAPDNSNAVRWLTNFFTDEGCVAAYNILLSGNLAVIDTLDANLFTLSNDQDYGPGKKRLMATMQSTQCGRTFFENVCQAMAGRKNNARVHVIEGFRLFSPSAIQDHAKKGHSPSESKGGPK